MSQGSVTSAKKKPAKKKTFTVGLGDLVMYHTPNQYQFGTFGEIVAILDDTHVVAKCLAPQDLDYMGNWVVLRTTKPTGVTRGQEPREHYIPHITKVVHRASPPAPKKPKKVLPPKVIETTAQLIEHLETGSAKERIIIATEKTEKPVQESA